MRTNTTELPEPSLAALVAVAQLCTDKAAGVQMRKPGEVIDGAVQTIRDIITTTLHGISSGIAGEATGEDLQRLHELRSLLEDLP